MTDKKDIEDSWLTKDKEHVERVIKNARNGAFFLFIFGMLGMVFKTVLILEGKDLFPELNIILTMCWIGFFMLYITSRYWALVYRLIPDETTSTIE